MSSDWTILFKGPSLFQWFNTSPLSYTKFSLIFFGLLHFIRLVYLCIYAPVPLSFNYRSYAYIPCYLVQLTIKLQISFPLFFLLEKVIFLASVSAIYIEFNFLMYDSPSTFFSVSLNLPTYNHFFPFILEKKIQEKHS